MDIEGQEIPELYDRITELEAEVERLTTHFERILDWKGTTMMSIVIEIAEQALKGGG
jgi:hypothetical protein